VGGLLIIDAVGLLTRVNSTNVLDEGLRIGGRGHRMNSKVKVSQTRRVYACIENKRGTQLAQSQSIPGRPLLAVDGFCVTRTRGTTRRTQRFERRGLNVGDLGLPRNTVTEALSRRTHNALQRETPSFTQVQGPHGEVKPLLPAFLYYDAIPREEYKVLVTEL
jgi:hypothetical protein